MTWHDLLRSFAALAVCWAGMEKLLQEGRLRRAASMVFGLLSLLLWLGGLRGLLGEARLPAWEEPQALLETTAASGGEDVWAYYEAHMDWQAEQALRAAGCEGEVEVELASGAGVTHVRLTLSEGDWDSAVQAVAEALALPAEVIQRE